MIDEIYNSRQSEIKTCHTSDEWKQTAISTLRTIWPMLGIVKSAYCVYNQVLTSSANTGFTLLFTVRHK